MIRITMQNGKTIDIELDHSAAPITCENFEKLVKDGFYNGLTFHRIIPGFMIQGGDPQGTGMGGPGWHIKGEFLQNGVANPIPRRHQHGPLDGPELRRQPVLHHAPGCPASGRQLRRLWPCCERH